jgi:hypothetical protein
VGGEGRDDEGIKANKKKSMVVDYKWAIYLLISVAILPIGIAGLNMWFQSISFLSFSFNKDLTCQLIITEFMSLHVEIF